MLGKIIGATIGRKAANKLGTTVGGPAGAILGYGLASRRFRGAAIGGLAVMGGLKLYKALRERNDKTSTESSSSRAGMPDTNGDPLPAYAPHV
ncbi:MAG: hypothetical protein WA906_05570 [Pacificimonas sp.]